MKVLSIALIGLLPWCAYAQNGDKKGESQAPLPDHLVLPPSPPLSPEDALASFKLPPEFGIELVAAEPLVGDPVAMQFDPDGRIWVVEMRGYMPNIEGTGEDKPVGQVVVLEDTNGDGRMDQSTVFLDNLVMPRAIALIDDGVVIAEPPRLWFCKDTNGDLKCDERTEIANDYATQNDPKHGMRSNPEHASNGLMWAMDNWIYSANHDVQFRYEGGEWMRQATHSRGQWGISQDNYGRIYYNSNSDQLRGDILPAAYLKRNPHLSGAKGAGVRLASSQEVWPARINPGVNRGYRSKTLREDGRLRSYTGACGPVIYRGNQFPLAYQGNAFVCEPTGNLVRRNIITERHGALEANNAYSEMEFLTSTDERFRPVNAFNGPDGTLYIVDFYRGLIQHRIYLTSFLRGQIEDRGLYEPIGLGRIYRVYHKGKDRQKTNPLSTMSTPELAAQLGHENGWTRSVAQRLLVERRDPSIIPTLNGMVSNQRNPLAQLHALWTLDGMGGVEWPTIEVALKATHPKVRSAAIRVSEAHLNGSIGPVTLERLTSHQFDLPEVQLQLGMTLGESQDPKALKVLANMLSRNANHPYMASAILSGLENREADMLQAITQPSGWLPTDMNASLTAVHQDLAACVIRSGDTSSLLTTIALLQGLESSLQKNILAGFRTGGFKKSQGEWVLAGEPITLPSSPDAILEAVQSSDKEVAELANRVLEAFSWPGKATTAVKVTLAEPLTETQQERFETGKTLYTFTCGACHQPHGMGQEGLAPPLKDSDWATGSEGRMIRIALHGLQGPIEVHGKNWELLMPGLATALDDDQIASILTYVRREWGHTASPVDPQEVKSVRDQYPGREDMWTVADLVKLP